MLVKFNLTLGDNQSLDYSPNAKNAKNGKTLSDESSSSAHPLDRG